MTAQPNWFERLLFGQNVWAWSNFAHTATGYRYVTLAKRDIKDWPRDWHINTGYKYYVQPYAVKIAVPKVRKKIVESRSFVWPDMFKAMEIVQSDPGGANMYGQGPGIPLQRGTSSKRTITWGWAAYGEQNRMEIPKPESGKYWISGDPNPSYDKTSMVVSPDGVVYELIQFDQNAPETPFSNQALNAGGFKDGKLISGRPTGAGGVSNAAYLWSLSSNQNPHTQALILPDYNGADGLLPSEKNGYDVPKINDLFMLDPDSESAKNMFALGGDCAIRARALVEYGCEVVDRSGYSDSSGSEIGTKPHNPELTIQAGKWPDGSNISKFKIDIKDLRFVTYFEYLN